MYQYDDPTCVAALPTPAALGAAGYFSNGNPTTGLGATVLTADYMNMVMLELLNVVKAGGISPSKTAYDQVLSAIKRIGQNTVVLPDSGTTNTYAASNPVPLVASTWVDGVVQAVRVAHTNTGASTYSPDGLTAIPIYGLGLQPLQGGEIAAGGTAILMHATILNVNGGNPVCLLMECAGGAQQTAPATALQHAPQCGQVQRNAFNYAGVAGGTANALTATLTPAPASYTDDLAVVVRVTSNNTGATTLNVNGLGTIAILGAGHQPLQGGELEINGFACFGYSLALGAFILLWTTGGAVPVAPATQSQHAVQLGQVSGIVGSARNLRMSVTATSASATLAADEIVVETALGGLRYCLAGFNKTINLATTGAGGMDTGAAPVSGYVALYAIYSPTSGMSALLATNATSSAVGSVYGGANMPSGYTASALVSVWPTDSSGRLAVGYQGDRRVHFPAVSVLNASAQSASYVSFSIASAVPPSARRVQGMCNTQSNGTAAVQGVISPDANGTGSTLYSNAASTAYIQFEFDLPLMTTQVLYRAGNVSVGTFLQSASVYSYDI